jgi:hypothetical protein
LVQNEPLAAPAKKPVNKAHRGKNKQKQKQKKTHSKMGRLEDSRRTGSRDQAKKGRDQAADEEILLQEQREDGAGRVHSSQQKIRVEVLSDRPGSWPSQKVYM